MGKKKRNASLKKGKASPVLSDNDKSEHNTRKELAKASMRLLLIEKEKAKIRQVRKPQSVVEKMPQQKGKGKKSLQPTHIYTFPSSREVV